MATPSFRFAGHDDIGSVVALVQSAYRGPLSRAGWTHEADLLDGQRLDAPMLEAMLDDDAGVVLLAEIDGDLVACCALGRPGPDGTASLGLFAVDPTRQANGIGRQVLDEAAAVTSAWGARHLAIEVIDLRHELISWYARRGFTPTGETRPFPYDDERFGLPQRDDLRFTVLARPLPPPSATRTPYSSNRYTLVERSSKPTRR
jgi:GNAT superfamily N-acetyltransferase